jgi:hypothetical protein
VRGPSVKPVTVEPLRTVKIDFPLVKTGHIRGRVYIDKNNNGTYDKFEDEPIPNARVYLSPEVKDTLTFSDGTYSFDYIYPGDYNVCVDLRGPVVNYRLISPEKIPVKLKEEEKLTDLDFKFASKPIQMDYFGSE